MPACPICLTGRTIHGDCFRGAPIWVVVGEYDVDSDHDLARRLTPTCYLCGVAAAEDCEHVIPRIRGGHDRWTNVGGACGSCNMRKSDSLTPLTDDQHDRWVGQQNAYRAAYSRSTTSDEVGPALLRAALPPTYGTADIEDVRDQVQAYVDSNDLGFQVDIVAADELRIGHLVIAVPPDVYDIFYDPPP